MLSQLKNIYTRERHPLQSTDFSFTRFLVPLPLGHTGWSLFMDCDMLVLDDIAKLWALRDERYAVQVVKHNHVPKEDTKFLGAKTDQIREENWSSVILFNNAKCRALTPEYVNTATGLELHQFKWLGNDDLIGEIPRRWNHLVGYDAPDPTYHSCITPSADLISMNTVTASTPTHGDRSACRCCVSKKNVATTARRFLLPSDVCPRFIHVLRHAEGTRLVAEQRLAEARTLLERICHGHAADREAWYLLGAIHQQLGDLPQAASCYAQALALCPDHADTHYHLGNVLRELGNVERRASITAAPSRRLPGTSRRTVISARCLSSTEKIPSRSSAIGSPSASTRIAPSCTTTRPMC